MAPQLKRTLVDRMQHEACGGSVKRPLCSADHTAGRPRGKRRSLGGSEPKLSAFFGAPVNGPLPRSAEPGPAPAPSKASNAMAVLRQSLSRMKNSLDPLVQPEGRDARAAAEEPAQPHQENTAVTLGRRQGLSKACNPFKMFAGSGKKATPADAGGSSGGGSQVATQDCFHSLSHIPRFGSVASAALKQVESNVLEHDNDGDGKENGGHEQQRHVARQVPGTHGRAHEAAKKPFKPPRVMQPGSGSSAAVMDIRAFAYAKP